MSAVPAIVILGSSALALAEKIRAALGEAEIHGLAARGGDTDTSFAEAMPHIAALFAEGRPIVGICAAGILIRALGGALQTKHVDPPVIAVAKDGSSVVPLLGGHHGANDSPRGKIGRGDRRPCGDHHGQRRQARRRPRSTARGLAHQGHRRG